VSGLTPPILRREKADHASDLLPMTTRLRPGSWAGGTPDDSWASPPARRDDRLEPGQRRNSVGAWLTRHPAWPITALLAGYPLWWALGTGDYMWVLLAVPMASRMIAWRAHGSRRLRVPPGFSVWLLFLVWAVAGVSMLTLAAPGTIESPVSHRLVSYAIRTGSYIGITVMLLYAGNLTETELPRRKLAWLMGLLGIYITVLGVAGILAPAFQFASPLVYVLPKGLQANSLVSATLHPGLAQLQDVFGASTQPRPKAPFSFTNVWGQCLTMTVPWLVMACQQSGSRRQRIIGSVTLAFALVALVYSLNRGAWIGTGVAAAYIAVRLAARGRIGMLGGLAAALAAVAIIVIASPLHTVISLRLQNGKSNDIRSSLSALAVRDALASPILGYGDTRQQRGSPQSITVGPSDICPLCGAQAVGGTGQLWLLLICDGFVGAALYFGFFGYAAWRYRRDLTPYGLVGVLVIVLSFVYMFTYDEVPAPLGLTMLSVALLWRNEQHLRQDRAATGRRPTQIPRPRRLAIRMTEVAGTTPEATARAR
jgi:O-Antigen ligase